MSESNPSLSVDALWRVEETCQRFEEACKKGQQPRIEDFLTGQCDQERSSLLRELLLIDGEYRQRAGDTPGEQEYLQRFCDHAGVVREVCARAGWANQSPGSAAPLSEEETLAPQSESSPTVTEVERVSVPGYDILGELGRGGMGVVYKARHQGLHRVVALKMILSGAHAGTDDVHRFLSEAEAVASFQHPHIVQVFEVNQHNTLPFMALEFVEGGSLADLVKKGPLAPRKAARVVEQMAQGMNAAHQAGIVHRDLKPDNVLLTADGVPKITDFGLAKKVQGGSGVTQTGAILGTPSYMAPEQASGEGKRVGPSADVYALGAVLYACLTGRPPFQGSTTLDTVLQVLNEEPQLPSLLNRGIPRDLEIICLKCLHKQPHRRYPSAEALAEDLRRWQNGEPIRARSVGKTERLLKWVKRRPAVAGLMLAGMMLLLLVGIGGPLLAWHQANLRQQAEKARGLADARALSEARAKQKAQDETKRAEEAKKRTEKEKQRVEQEKQRAKEATQRARDELHRAEWQIYLGNLREAQLALDMGDYATASQRLDACRWDFRGWEHDYLFTRLHQGQVTLKGHTQGVQCVAFSPDGTRLASGSRDNTVKVWDTNTGEVLLTLRGHSKWLNCVAFSPDGRWIVSGSRDKTLMVWDARTGQKRFTLKGHTSMVHCVSFSPDGKRLASGCWGKAVKIWDANTWKEIRTIRGQVVVLGVSFSSDGQQIVSGQGGAVTVWDANTGVKLRTLYGHTSTVRSVSFNPDGQRIVSGSQDKHIKVWDARSGRELMTLSGHQSSVESVLFSPDGQRIISGSQDRTIKVWDANNGKELTTLRGHGLDVLSVSVSPDGRRIASGSLDNTIKVWDANRKQGTMTFRGHGGQVHTVAVSPDGRQVISSGGGDLSLKVWDATTSKELRTLRGHSLSIRCVALSPDGKWIVSGSADKTLIVWDARTDQKRAALRGHPGSVDCVSFSPDGKRLVSECSGRTLKIWDTNTWKELRTIRGQIFVHSLSFSPDGEEIISGRGNGAITVWDANTGEELRTWQGHNRPVVTVAFSPDGRRIVTGSVDKTIKVWDTRTGKKLRTLRGHTHTVLRVAFSPDGQRIASGGEDNTLRIWDANSNRELLTLRGHAGPVRVAFSPDGKRLASGSHDRTIKLWDAHIRQERRTLAAPTPRLHRVSFSEKGAFILAQGPGGKEFVWDAITGKLLPDKKQATLTPGASRSHPQAEPRNRKEPRVVRLEGGNIVIGPHGRLTALEQINRKRLARWAKPDPEWHQQQAEQARKKGHNFAAAFHQRRAAKERAEAIPRYEAALAKEPGNLEVATALARLLVEEVVMGWKELKPTAIKSQEGATLKVLPDDSVLASGTVPDNDTYTITAPVPGKQIAAIRVEALTHSSLPKQGSGRHPSGNFHLSEVHAHHLSNKGERTPLVLTAATADHVRPVEWDTAESNGPWGAIDGKAHTRWDIWPQVRQDHWVAFQVAPPCGITGGDKVIVQLDFHDPKWKKETLGRFRLSVTERPDALLLEQMCSAITQGQLLGYEALAAGYFVQGKWEQVNKVLTERVLNHPRVSPVGWLLFALTCHKLNKAEQARQAYHRAVRSLEHHKLDELVRVLARQAMITLGGVRPSQVDAQRKLHRIASASQLREVADGRWWDGDARMQEALAWVQAGQPDRAALAYVQAVLTKKYQPFRLLRILRGHTAWVGSVAFSPDASLLASCTYRLPLAEQQGELWVWDAKTGKRLLILKGHSQDILSVAFSPDGKLIVSGSADQTAKVWDVATGKHALTLKKHTNPVTSVAFSPDGKRIVTGSWDDMVKVWEAASGKEVLSFKGHIRGVNSLAFSPDSKRLAGGGWDDTVKVWDAATGKEILAINGHTRSVRSVAFSPDGKRIASGSDDRTVKVWDATTGTQVLSLNGHTRDVTSVSFSPDGKHLITGSADQTAKVWDAATGKQTLLFGRHTNTVRSVAFSSDGKRIATGSHDRTVRIWNVSDLTKTEK